MLVRVWHVFWREYWGHLKRPSYLIFTFGFPAFLLIMPALGGLVLAVAIRSAMPEPDLRPIGIVDQAELFEKPPNPPQSFVQIQAYPTQSAARKALDDGETQAFYFIPADYWATGRVQIIYHTPPVNEIDGLIQRWVRQRIRAHVPDDLLGQLDRPPHIIRRTISGDRVFGLDELIIAGLVFFLSYFIQLGSSFTANYMFDSIASEANDRTIEIVLTSISPMQFLLGKVSGLLMVGLTQLGVWGGLGIGILAWGSSQLDLNLFDRILSWSHLELLVSMLLGAYMTTQLLAAAIGLLQINSGSGPLLFNTLNWVIGAGWLYAIAILPRNPHTPIAIAASLFPLTSPIVLIVRVIVAEVPFWQMLLGQMLLWATNISSLFLLRRLLQTNLVAYAPKIRLGPWLKSRWLTLQQRR